MGGFCDNTPASGRHNTIEVTISGMTAQNGSLSTFLSPDTASEVSVAVTGQLHQNSSMSGRRFRMDCPYLKHEAGTTELGGPHRAPSPA